ncbi:MAG: hypothetical protein V3U76_07885 [Granulosicoccus sp.]
MIAANLSTADDHNSAIVSDPLTGPTVEILTDLDSWYDPDLGFSLAIPAGWKPIVIDETELQLDELEPGYSIGFESPLRDADDHFADYIMIEILPGVQSGEFETDGSHRRSVVIDGVKGWRDELLLQEHALVDQTLELIVRQASIRQLGYTVGLYAVAESDQESLIDDVFEIMLRTFRLPEMPFSVS